MEQPCTAIVFPSRFPKAVRAAYVESFRMRRMDHQFHYDSEKQAQLWLELHEAYSPARTDRACEEMYETAFKEVGKRWPKGARVFSLGCGGGQKDELLLQQLPAGRTSYVATDVSLPLVLTALQRNNTAGVGGVVFDLARTGDLDEVFSLASAEGRIFAFFGMLPNFEPAAVLPKIAAAMGPGDELILSANLAPGAKYEEGVRKILPLYDNELTRRWLVRVLVEAGLDAFPEEIEFSIETVGELKRIEANYRFSKEQRLRLDGEEFVYREGETFRLFFSYRHTPALLGELLAKEGFKIWEQWIAPSEEEGVFLCGKII